jgi:outer membrane protein TolC
MNLLLTRPTHFQSTLLIVAAGFFLTVSSAALAHPTLGVAELARAAFEQHPSLRASSARLEAAKAKVDAAKWQFWPTPSVGVERLQNDPSAAQQGDRTVSVVRMQQPLWMGGRLTSKLQRADSEVLLAQAETDAARELLATRVIQAWSSTASNRVCSATSVCSKWWNVVWMRAHHPWLTRTWPEVVLKY